MAPNHHQREQIQQWLPAETETAPKSAPPGIKPAPSRRARICTQCGSIGKPQRVAGGSLLVELALWLFFLVPGFIYSLWRISTKRPACRACGAIHAMVPLHSPRGRELAAQFSATTRPTSGD